MNYKLSLSLLLLSIALSSCSKTNFKESPISNNFSTSQAMPVAEVEAASTDSKEAMLPPPSSAELPPGHPVLEGQERKDTPKEKISNIKKVDGGYTIEDCFKNKTTLDGKTVTIRGKVTKYNSGIMNKNWLHLQDGTGSAGTNDIEVTTTTTAKVNDTIVVTGVIHYNKDIGSGYSFAGIIEDAKIKIE